MDKEPKKKKKKKGVLGIWRGYGGAMGNLGRWWEFFLNSCSFQINPTYFFIWNDTFIFIHTLVLTQKSYHNSLLSTFVLFFFPYTNLVVKTKSSTFNTLPKVPSPHSMFVYPTWNLFICYFLWSPLSIKKKKKVIHIIYHARFKFNNQFWIWFDVES